MQDTQQHLLSLAADVGAALTCCERMDEMLDRCAKAIVKHLDAAFARVWVYDDETEVLVLRASAGLYTHLDGRHSRIKIGEYKIGKIAEMRKPHLTNDVTSDPRVDVEWARANGIVAFAGLPLLIEERLIGVVAMFSQHDLSENTLIALETVAGGIALGIHRMHIQEQLSEREHVFAQFANHIRDVLWIVRPRGAQSLWFSPAIEEVFGHTVEEHYNDPMLFMECVLPEDHPKVYEFIDRLQHINADSPKKVVDAEFRIKRPDGAIRWLWARGFPSLGPDGKVYQICGFTHDITERKEAERRVAEFYSTVSHELRTPLTSIRAALGLLEGGVTELNSAESMDLISIALHEADRLIRLINDILDMRKMEAGKLIMRIASLEPSAVVNGTLGAMRGFAQEYNVELVTWIQEEKHFLGDYDRVLQVLANLLSNAIKFSPAGGTVTLSVEAGSRGRIKFSVSDNGPGIPAHQQGKLFGLFQQLDSSDSRARGGTGLGLAISKAIVEKLGGTIGFSSEEEKGSTFWFELPMTEQPAAEPEPGVQDELDPRNHTLRDLVDEYTKALPARLESLKSRLKEAKLTNNAGIRAECLAEARKIGASSEPCGLTEVAHQMIVIEQLLEQLGKEHVDRNLLWLQIDFAMDTVLAVRLRR